MERRAGCYDHGRSGSANVVSTVREVVFDQDFYRSPFSMTLSTDAW